MLVVLVLHIERACHHESVARAVRIKPHSSILYRDLYLGNQWAAYTTLYQPFGEPVQPLKKDLRKFGPA